MEHLLVADGFLFCAPENLATMSGEMFLGAKFDEKKLQKKNNGGARNPSWSCRVIITPFISGRGPPCGGRIGFFVNFKMSPMNFILPGLPIGLMGFGRDIYL